MPKKPKFLARRELFSSRLFRGEEVDLCFSNGEVRTYERLLAGASIPVIVVPMLDDDTVLMIREYGIGVEGYELTLPKGRADPGESALETANRELKEEIGYGARELVPLKCMTQSPGYMQHKTQIVLARQLFRETLVGDEPEPLIVESQSLSSLAQWIGRDDISEARTIAALFLAANYMQTR